MGNTYVAGDKKPRFFDWQIVNVGPWSIDLSYFMVGALSIADRQQHEMTLLRHYLDILSASGIGAPSFDEAVLAYRQHHVHGLMWATCLPEMQKPERIAAITERYATAATDHNTLEVLNA